MEETISLALIFSPSHQLISLSLTNFLVSQTFAQQVKLDPEMLIADDGWINLDNLQPRQLVCKTAT